MKIWPSIYQNINFEGIIFMIKWDKRMFNPNEDNYSNLVKGVSDSRKELHYLMNEDFLKDKPLIVIFNVILIFFKKLKLF